MQTLGQAFGSVLVNKTSGSMQIWFLPWILKGREYYIFAVYSIPLPRGFCKCTPPVCFWELDAMLTTTFALQSNTPHTTIPHPAPKTSMHLDRGNVFFVWYVFDLAVISDQLLNKRAFLFVLEL